MARYETNMVSGKPIMFVGILYLDNQNPFPAVFSCVTLVKATASGRQCCELQWSQTWSGNRIITLWRGQGGRIGRGACGGTVSYWREGRGDTHYLRVLVT